MVNTIKSNFLPNILSKDLFKNLTLLCKLCLNAFFFAIEIAFLDMSTPIPVENLEKHYKINKIQPDPVPISSISIFFDLYFSSNSFTNNSVSGLGIRVFLLTSNFLLQNSFSSNI